MSRTPSSALGLAEYTASALVIPRLQGSTTSAVMEELCEVLRGADHALPDLRFDSRAAIGRELLTGVDLMYGTVFPRVRVSGIQRPRFALGRAAQPLHWLVTLYPPTELIFLMAEPNFDSAESGQLVETLTRLRRDQVLLNELRLARTPEEMLMLLERFPLVSGEDLALVQTQRLQCVSRNAARSFPRGLLRRR